MRNKLTVLLLLHIYSIDLCYRNTFTILSTYFHKNSAILIFRIHAKRQIILIFNVGEYQIPRVNEQIEYPGKLSHVYPRTRTRVSVSAKKSVCDHLKNFLRPSTRELFRLWVGSTGSCTPSSNHRPWNLSYRFPLDSGPSPVRRHRGEINGAIRILGIVLEHPITISLLI